MVGSEDWLFRPVLRGLIKYESLRNGELNLFDVALLNEALDVDRENQIRAEKAIKHGRQSTHPS